MPGRAARKFKDLGTRLTVEIGNIAPNIRGLFR
jgi:hypothetical protein